MSSRGEKMVFSKSSEKSERIQLPIKETKKTGSTAPIKMSLISFQSKWDDTPKKSEKKTEKKYTIADHINPESDEMKKISLEASLVTLRTEFSYMCRNAGITNKKIMNELNYKFFGNIHTESEVDINSDINSDIDSDDEKVEKGSIVSNESSIEDQDEILQRQSVLKSKTKSASGTTGASSKVIESDDKKEITPHDITRAGFVLIMLINRYFHFNQDAREKLPEEVVQKMKEFRQELTKMPMAFDFEHNLPKHVSIPTEFFDNLVDLDIIPFQVNFNVDTFIHYFNVHTDAIISVGLNINQKGIIGCAHPERCTIIIQNNKIISLTTFNKYNVSFIFACSSLSLTKFPKEIKYMPREISAYLEKLPTIGAFYASIQNPSNIRPLTNWTNSEDGSYITADQIKPSSEYITEIITFASKIVEAIHNTAVNRNSRSEKHSILVDGRKTIFKVQFLKYILFLGHIFGPELSLIEQVASSLKDFRFLDLSIQISIVAGLLMIGENTKPLEYASQGFTDYMDLINYRKGESPEDKKERIGNVNSALYFVIKNLHEISLFGACKKTFTSYESKLYNAWFKNVFELFPKNCKDDSFDVEKIFEDKFEHKFQDKHNKESKGSQKAAEEFPVMYSETKQESKQEIKQEKPVQKKNTGKGAWGKPIQFGST